MLPTFCHEIFPSLMQTYFSPEKTFPPKLNYLPLILTFYSKLIGDIQVASQFDRLLSSSHQTQGFLFAQGTKKNIKSHLRQFILFCVYFNRQVVPSSRETLLAFLELFSVTASYDHLKNVYSSIKFLHKALNLPFLDEEFQITSVLQSIKRKLAKTPFQVLPITPKIFVSLLTLHYGAVF